jgi:hypothetical protein
MPHGSKNTDDSTAMGCWRRYRAWVYGTLLVLAVVRLGHQREASVGARPRGIGDSRIVEYCTPPVDRGSEGVAAPGLELLALAVVIRHGDRSQIAPLPTEKPVKWDCGKAAWWEKVDSSVAVLATKSVLPEIGSDGGCLPGQLTQLGSRQLQRLGRHLRSSYEQLLERTELEGLYVRSTNFTRTKASAASLISTMFEGNPALASGGRITVDVRGLPESPLEPMHGSHTQCAAAAHGSSVELATRRRPVAEYSDVATLFGPTATRMKITDFADSANAATCHSRLQPCGDGGCISSELHRRLMATSDSLYCGRYGGDSGGRAAWSLSMYPFLSEVTDRLAVAAARARSASPQPSVAIFAGHDTVIAPVLAALGQFGVEHWCGWPAYASRIAFELYHKPAAAETYVRVVFNGEALRGVRGCESNTEYCRLSDFQRGVESVLGGAPDYLTACAAAPG